MKYPMSIAGAVALALLAGSTVAAPDSRFVLPPGLYKIEMVGDTSLTSPAGSVSSRSTTDARTGNVNTQYRRADGSRGGYTVGGEGQQRICIRPAKTVEIPKELLKDGCKTAKGEIVGNRMVSTSTCSWGRIKTTMHQLDEKTWESTTESVFTGPPSPAQAAGGLAFMRSMAEKMAREGNAQERAEAQRSLALFKQMEGAAREMPKVELPPEAAAAMQRGGAGAVEQKSVQRLTRLGDCQG